MYRLLKVRSLYLGNRNVSIKPADCLVQTSYLCSFCKFYHQQPQTYQQLKHYSTTVKPSQISTKIAKKIKHGNSKFVEILEVTKNLTTSRRTKVKQLNAANLSQFVNQEKAIKKEDIKKIHLIEEINLLKQNLDEKNKKKKKSKKQLKKSTIVETKKETEECLVMSDKNNFQELDSLDVDHKIIDQNLVPEELIEDDPTEKIILTELKQRISQVRQQNKTEIRQENLFSFFQTCTYCGRVKQAFDTFILLRKSKSPYLLDNFKNIRVHNLFLKEFSMTADLKNVILLRNLMNEYSIKMNQESYAFIFECIGRTEDPSKEIELLTSLKKQMEENNISLNDIVTRPLFVKDQFEKVLQAVRLLNENFTPFFHKKRTSYSCHLLNNVFVNRTYESPASGLFNLSDMKERARKQCQIEFDEEVKVQSIVKKLEPTPQVLQAREKIEAYQETWKKQVRRGFDRSLKSLKAREKGLYISNLLPYLTVLEPEIYVDLIMREINTLIQSNELFSPPLSYLTKELAHSIFKKYENKCLISSGLIDNIMGNYDEYCKWYLEGGEPANGRIHWQHLEEKLKEKGGSSSILIGKWSINVLKDVGKFLYDIILKDVKIEVSSRNDKKILVPAFYISFRSKYKLMLEEIKPHPALPKLFQDSQVESLTFKSELLPSLIPPKPWFQPERGGYLINQPNLIRVNFGFTGQLKKVKSMSKEKIYPSLDCLNQLGSIPWRVNTSILDVAMKVFQDGGSEKLNVPEPPSVLPTVAPATDESTHEEKCEILKMRMHLRRRKNEMYSLWCDALYKLSLANHFRDEIFWLPHNMDFRGRVYPIPPHMSQMGSDLARSMLIFAQRKPLGRNGLDWLKIHVINLTGFRKKESIQKRLQYANEVLDIILDSAENPLTGEMWWATSDEPWQTLAACMEISKALKSPNPCEYLTGFPVHQDGSCNGLQHYAALGRDQFGAESVNLCPFDQPRDVYSDVVILVENIRKLDAENGVEIAQVLEGYILRKVIKQTIMTTVYGVTKFGARLQIRKQLKEFEDFPEDKIWKASSYLAEKTFESLRTMFKSAKEIQDWFTECAKLICAIRETAVEWETVLGLPVIQPYFKSNAVENLRPNAVKQKNAFPPNFIHSLDSTHMMLTSLHCEQAGITFMSVHDCFWTHPSTVSKMNEICRKQFIALHSEPILENLSLFLLDSFKFSEQEIEESKDHKVAEMKKNLNKVLAQVPSKGTYDLDQVQFSAYFFS